jgi:extradiol dioxygenase family protein
VRGATTTRAGDWGFALTAAVPSPRSSAPRWVDFNFFGHQLVCHLVDGFAASASHNAVRSL